MKKASLLLGLFIITGIAFAQYPQHTPSLIPEWVKDQKGWIVYSDFGPRNLAGLTFHDRIDYANNAGKTIYPVEPGDIFRVTLSKGKKAMGIMWS